MRRGHLLWGMAVVFGAAQAAAESAAEPEPEARLDLHVLLVNDPDFPQVSRGDAEAILAEARRTVADKFGFSELHFHIEGVQTIQEFFAAHADAEGTCARSFAERTVRPGVRNAKDMPREAVKEFLRRWKVGELREFFPQDKRAGLDSYDILADRLLEEFDRKLGMIAGFELSNGESLLAPEKLDYRSYVRWICAVRSQGVADLILTNAFMLYDLGTEPYPHSIFQKAKVGGASLLSPAREAMGGRAVVASTFSMTTDIPFFREEGVETLSTEERRSVIGTFIVAHELGHAVFKIPDFYDHPPECLMTTKFETGYVNGYRTLKKHPGACPQCRPYVVAKRHVFRASSARQRREYSAAITEIKQAIRKTPKHIDGRYLRYVADLSVHIAELYELLGEPREARRWLKSALRIVPHHQVALALQKRLGKSR